MLPATNRKRRRSTFENTDPTDTQGKSTVKKGSTSIMQSKPAKRIKRSRSDDGHAVDSRSKTYARAKDKTSNDVPTKTNKDNNDAFALGPNREALPIENFVLSEQTAKRLNAWRLQPSPTTLKSHGPREYSHSNIVQSTESRPRLMSNIEFLPRPVQFPNNDRLPILSPITSMDVIRGSQGYGYSIFGSTSSPYNSCLTTFKAHLPALPPPRQPPSTGQVLETIVEESIPSSYNCTQKLPNMTSELSIAPLCDSTGPSFTSAPIIGSDRAEDNIFEELADDDLLDLENIPDTATYSPMQALRTSIPTVQNTHCAASSIRHPATLEPDVIEVVSDDEWVMLEDQKQAFMDLTMDEGPARPPRTPYPIPTAACCVEALNSEVSVAAANSRSDKTTLPSHQIQELPQTQTIETGLTGAESTEDYLSSVLHLPIIRPPFPAPIQHCSPIIGVSSSLLLRTCFRLGECLNIGCNAARNSNTQSSDSILLELYAKVVSSHRDANGVTQHFVFADLFHEMRGPFLNATCETWRGSELWEYDCGRFLGTEGEREKRICRAVGRMKREGGKWKFVVLNIWEATWEDVEFVRSIICGP
jgi:hypothetical protein